MNKKSEIVLFETEDKNDALFDNGRKLIDDSTLVALTIMIAESKPEEKEMMISVIMNCMG